MSDTLTAIRSLLHWWSRSGRHPASLGAFSVDTLLMLTRRFFLQVAIWMAVVILVALYLR